MRRAKILSDGQTQGINKNAARFHAMPALVVPAEIPGETTFPGEGAGESG